MIKVAGYGRMSTDDQQLSPQVQEDMIRSWFALQQNLGKWEHGAKFVGMFVDHAVSSRIDLLDRKAGEHLITTLSPGDLIVVAKYNRAFRSPADAERTLKRLEEAEIKIEFLDVPVDVRTANGKLVSGLMATVSLHERELRSETTKDALRTKRKLGHCIGRPPYGYKIKYHPKKNGMDIPATLQPDIEARQLGNAARKLLIQGTTRLQAYRTLRWHHRQNNLSTPISELTLVRLAAASCLDYPPYSNAFVSKQLGIEINSVEFIRRKDHSALKDKLVSLLAKDGYQWAIKEKTK